MDAGLIKADELRPYLEYWIRILTGQMPDRHDPEVFLLLLNYIEKYEFDRVTQLIKQFGHNPTPDAAAVENAIKATVDFRAKFIRRIRQQQEISEPSADIVKPIEDQPIAQHDA